VDEDFATASYCIADEIARTSKGEYQLVGRVDVEVVVDHIRWYG
jgi:hypothetical protein